MFGSHSSSFRPLKGFLGALLWCGLWYCATAGLAQDLNRKVVKKVTPQYPSILKTKGIGGIVRLKVFIKADGSVRDTELIGGNPILAESAQKAVLQWKFAPASSETNMEIAVVFDPHSEN
jgi:TonB family protein